MADALEKRREDTSTSVVRPRSAYSKRFMLANLLVVAGFVGCSCCSASSSPRSPRSRRGRSTRPRAATSSRRLRTWSTTSPPSTATEARRSPSSRHSRSSTATRSWTASPSRGRRCVRLAAGSPTSSPRLDDRVRLLRPGSELRPAPGASRRHRPPPAARVARARALHVQVLAGRALDRDAPAAQRAVERRGLHQAATRGAVPRQAAERHAPRRTRSSRPTR